MNDQFIKYVKKNVLPPPLPPMFASTRHRKCYDVSILGRHTLRITANYSDQTNFWISLNN